ncbi:MAG TPA: hypothetical protein VFP90_14660, partial [Gemmatimonadaceae bacterium]|nr:hypothetical protein [Gemmatimonadaceae bacterium]
MTEQRHTGLTLDAALDALGAGVLLLDRELRVTHANARWEGWRGATIPAGTPLTALVDLHVGESLLELERALADGDPHVVHLLLSPARADSAARYVSATARRVGGGLVLEAHEESDEERIPLHAVARRLAEVVDMAEVLRTLCDIAAQQCHGAGASVLRMTGRLGEVVAAVGNM